MKILLGSKNPSKEKAVQLALITLGIKDYEIIMCEAPSNTHSRPIGYEIIRGAENRNSFLKEYADSNGLSYDYLCSIEGGFSLDETGLPFVVTYCIIENKNGKQSTGKSLGIKLTDKIFHFIKKGGSLNSVINDILQAENIKQSLGIMGYLTNGLFDRASVDSEAVVSSFLPFLYEKQINILEAAIDKLNE